MTECVDTVILPPGGQDPAVGLAATLYVGSDRYPLKVVEVKGTNNKRVTVARVEHYDTDAVIYQRETGGYGWHKVIDVTAPSVVLGRREVFTLRKNGLYVLEGQGLRSGWVVNFGRAVDYRDPHF